MPLLDRHGRPLRNLRISVTDLCNLRCGYCMPEESYVWLPRGDLLRFEELGSLVSVLAGLGVEKVRLTGGEPLQRQDLPELVRILASEPRLTDIALTTNGVQLADHAVALRDAGLRRLTVSLDSLQRERFAAIAGRNLLHKVLAGLDAARSAGFRNLKIDTVVLRGENDAELGDLISFGREIGAEVRFIEYMDVGGATRWAYSKVVSRAEMLATIAAQHGDVEPVGARGSDPAERFRLRDGTVFGIIASTTAPFCGACDRARLTADGVWYQCLYARSGLDLRGPLRGGATPAEIAALVTRAWESRLDRGAEQRLGEAARGPMIPVEALRRDPHLEMHTRGG
ncbi:MAG: GTP 3',8-cyclase MoaA [Minicystis sp.]